jgi:hypothetical protein
MGTKIEGKDSKRFAVYSTDINSGLNELEAWYDTIEEVNAHPYRLDWGYKIRIPGHRFLTRQAFGEWAKTQK